MKRPTLFIALSVILLASCANDTYRDHVRRGNRAYEAAIDTLNHDSSLIYNACTEYERAIHMDSLQPVAHYNVGNAYLLSGKDSVAFEAYLKADSLETDYARKAHINRNIGVLLQNRSLTAPDSTKYRLLDGAVKRYKTSLRFDPKDDETRYNLALCLWQLKDGQGGGDGGEGQNNEQSQQDENGDQNKQDEQQQQQQDEQQQQQQQEQQQRQQSAEQMLQAAMQKEKDTQNRLNQLDRKNQDKQQNNTRRLQKNW